MSWRIYKLIFCFNVLVFLISCSKLPESKIKKIGISLWLKNDDFQKNLEGFIDGLEIAGFKEGENLELIILTSNGDISKHEQIIQAFKKNKVDLIFTQGTSATLLAKKIANNIPLVFSIVTFPLEANVIDSVNQASNRIAGTSNHIAVDYQYKVFLPLVPNLKSIAFIRSLKGQPNSYLQYKEFKGFFSKRNIQVLDVAENNIDAVLIKLRNNAQNYDLIYGSCDAIVQAGGEEKLANLAFELSKPSFSCNKSSVAKGFVAALVTDYYEIGKEAGFKASEILRSNNQKKILSSNLSTPILNLNVEAASKLGIRIPEELKRTIHLIIYPPEFVK